MMMSDRVPEREIEPRTPTGGGSRSNPYASTLLGIWVVAGLCAVFFLWAGRDSDPDAAYDPEGDLYTALGYGWAVVAVVAALVHLGVKAVLWKAPVG
jgi:hypothetical protein